MKKHDKETYLYQNQIPIFGEYEVVVVGGGTAGAFAGISSAREGRKSLIVEQFGGLGGTGSMGLVTPLMPTHIQGYDGVCPLAKEFNQRMEHYSAVWENGRWFDPTMMKCVLEEMAAKAQCDLLYYTVVVDVQKTNREITSLIVANKNGLSLIRAKKVIDATGDADVALLSGCSFTSGDENGINQPVSLRFEMANVDFEKFHAQQKEMGNEEENYFAMNTPGMEQILKKGLSEGIVTEQDIAYFQAFGVPGKPGAMNFNCPELVTSSNVSDTAFLTQKQIEGKQAILRTAALMKQKIKGFENAYISEIAPMVGIRESRRIHSIRDLTVKDIAAYQKFTDAVSSSHYPVDIHGALEFSLEYDDTIPKEEQYWQVPFRCMIPKEIDNLLVVGRCAGFDFIAQSAARVQYICRAMGEAAGKACNQSLLQNKTFAKMYETAE